jgi:hypothetical protein
MRKFELSTEICRNVLMCVQRRCWAQTWHCVIAEVWKRDTTSLASTEFFFVIWCRPVHNVWKCIVGRGVRSHIMKLSCHDLLLETMFFSIPEQTHVTMPTAHDLITENPVQGPINC